MRIFVTGASGYVGTAVTKDMVAAGHEVVGLARSDENEARLRAMGAGVLRGDLTDLDGLRRGAREADAVAHLAFDLDLSRLVESGEIEVAAIRSIGEVLAGTGKSFVATSGCGLIVNGELLTEDRQRPDDEQSFRHPEQETSKLFDKGVRAMIVRLPQVNGPQNRGFVPALINIARDQAFAAYIGDGRNRWPAGHRDDVAKLYRLAIENGRAGRIYHAVAEEGIRLRDLTGVIARHLDLPHRSIGLKEADAYYGFLAMFAKTDNPTSSTTTREELGWEPTEPTTFQDLANGDYFGSK